MLRLGMVRPPASFYLRLPFPDRFGRTRYESIECEFID